MSGTASSTTVDQSDSQEFGLVETLLAQQQTMTAVERFSALHDADPEHTGQPAQAKYYRELLPATPPAPGQQFGFSVDLDKCSGCKACVVACHTMNGLEDDESWRRVGTITIGDEQSSRIQHVTTACHHCEDPGCLNGCPVKAYDKDPVTGIVRHLDDQCIGCKYCTMMCPYEVPQYSERLGIVRKCDMCHQRLSTGEAPACVQACPNEAISIQIIDMPQVHFEEGDRLAPDAPVSTITRPSTTYVTAHDHSSGQSSVQDEGVDELAESHWPLAALLIATQVSVGMLVAERLAATIMWALGSTMPIEATRGNALIALVIGVIGMNLAPLHLGKPLRSWRVFLGLRTSWLSREAVVLGNYVAALGVAVALLWMPIYSQYLPDQIVAAVPSWAAKATLGAAILLGAAGLFSSAMIYVATQRQLWRRELTFPRFFGTALVCGLGLSPIALLLGGASTLAIETVAILAIATLVWKLAWEWKYYLGPPHHGHDRFDRRSRHLLREHLGLLRTARLACGITAVLALLAICLTTPMSLPVAVTASIFASTLLLAGESCERLVYFMTVVYERMPGTLR